MADDRALALARRLEEDDERLAAALEVVGGLQRDVAVLREQATAAADVLAAAPARLAAASASIEEAVRELERRREEAARAKVELEQAERSRDEQRLASARRAAVRTADSAAAGERRLARAAAAREDVGRERRDAEAAVPSLERGAAAVSERLAGVPRLSRSGIAPPGAGLDGVDEWASRVAAALFVVRSGLEAERERLVREANELASSVLGDPGAGTSVALVRARLERALA